MDIYQKPNDPGRNKLHSREVIKLKGVSFESPKRESLIEIEFAAHAGEVVIIFGPEESGLEILCPLIAGMINDFEGDVLYNGESIRTFDYLQKHTYRKKIGYLQRGYGLINNMSLEENIALPLKYHSKLSTVEIESFIDKYLTEMNLDHCRNLRPVDLLKSEILKTAFIRSITLDPDLLLLEHALDGQSFINVQTFINRFRQTLFHKEKAIIFVTHIPHRFIDFADKFIMLYKGNIVFSGTKDEYLISGNKYLTQYKNNSTDGPMRIE